MKFIIDIGGRKSEQDAASFQIAMKQAKKAHRNFWAGTAIGKISRDTSQHIAYKDGDGRCLTCSVFTFGTGVA